MHILMVLMLQMQVIQGENSLLKSQTSKLKNLEKEKLTLENHVKQLELSLAESKTNANILANTDASGWLSD